MDKLLEEGAGGPHDIDIRYDTIGPESGLSFYHGRVTFEL